MRRAWLLWQSVRNTQFRQLLHRLRFVVVRRLAAKIFGGRKLPNWWDAAIPSVRVRIPESLGEQRSDIPTETLPCEVDLAGTAFTLREKTDWAVPELTYGTRLEKLHLHYFDYLPRLEAESGKALILDWIRANPPYTPDYWLDGWNSYAVSIRIVAWIRFLVTTAELDESSRERIERSLARQLRFLYRNLEQDIGGNHIIRNIRALFWGAAFFAGEEARSWKLKAEALLGYELRVQVLPDGMHFERSPAYHNQVLHDLLECYALLGEMPLKSQLGEVLDKMMQVTVDGTHPDGLPSLFNDGGLHMCVEPGLIVELYEVLRHDRPSARCTWRLADAGYAAVRQKDCLAIVDCGRIGPDHLPAHAHGDIFSFEWTVLGKRLIVDAGVAEYHPGDLRDLSRSTRAHNTVTLDDQDQAEFWSSFRVGRRPDVQVEEWKPLGDGGFRLTACHDGYSALKGHPIHRRRFHVRADCLEIADQIQGGRGQEAVARLLVHPEAKLEPEERGVTIHRGAARVRLTTPVPIHFDDAVWMPDFGVEIPTQQIVLNYGTAPCEADFVLSTR